MSSDVLLEMRGMEIEFPGVKALSGVEIAWLDAQGKTGPNAVKECIGDRVPGAVAWTLFDIDAKFGDVHTVDECVEVVDRIGAANKVAAE